LNLTVLNQLSFKSFAYSPPLENFQKIQSALELKKGVKGINRPRQKKIKQEAEVTKFDYLVSKSGLSDFPRTDRVPVEF
jgi:hypothetical protein